MKRIQGFTLLEVLITLALLAFSLAALVNLQMKLQMAEVESYQRGQAVMLVQDMADRIKAAGIPAAANYVTGAGTNDDVGTDDTALDADNDGECVDDHPTLTANRDLCEWSNLLKGVNVVYDQGGADEASVGGIESARGCVEQVQAPNATPGVCTPGIYRVTVAWQGMHETQAPDLSCGEDQYPDASGEPFRRAISTVVSIGLPTCN